MSTISLIVLIISSIGLCACCTLSIVLIKSIYTSSTCMAI
ncbi:exported hypothetical protein [Clostridioides difficile T10]|nr:exported hypothetical protein [Clostridioides difficile T10]